MKQRPIHNKQDLEKASKDLLLLEDYLPFVLSITQGKKIRTLAQNARYWVDVEYFLIELNQAIQDIADETGYTPIQVRRIIAFELPEEYSGIMYVLSKESVHEMLKFICQIPTSTRLGTKEFSKYEERLEQTMTDIIGRVRALIA